MQCSLRIQQKDMNKFSGQLKGACERSFIIKMMGIDVQNVGNVQVPWFVYQREANHRYKAKCGL